MTHFVSRICVSMCHRELAALEIKPSALRFPAPASVHISGILRLKTILQPPGESHDKRVRMNRQGFLEMLCQSSCAWPDSNMCVTTNLSNSLTSLSLHPPPQPLIPLTPAVVLLLQSSTPPCNPLIPPSPPPPCLQMESTS